MKSDFFADIALAHGTQNSTDNEMEPRQLSSVIFRECEDVFPYGDIKVIQDYSEQELYENFQNELQDLKNKYRPFMENYLPTTKEIKKVYLNEFYFRFCGKNEIFTQVKSNDFSWEKVKIPDYRGPAEKWKAYYKTNFEINDIGEERIVIHFQCVDYKAVIYVNDNFVGMHEGFFAPFEFDVTDFVTEGKQNELIIEVHNDLTTKGDDGPILDGDKIYAATGPGWDDPNTGWHHCPAGGGVFGKVTIEYRPSVFIDDIFIRPDIDNKKVELRMGVINYNSFIKENYELVVEIYPKNFKENEKTEYNSQILVVGTGKNEYRYEIPINKFRLWNTETPYLYGAICTIKQKDKIVSQNVQHFGMRKFVSDENTNPKGKFFLNNEPIMLRGANEMGNLQRCVIEENFEQLQEDILIGKLCNINYFRIAQRPVQQEVYDYLDMLGVMNQTDFPLFSTMRRPQITEGIRQVGEMEHLLRVHPSTILVSFINEAITMRPTEDPNSKYSKRYALKGHRHVFRDELEFFFRAARSVIYIENPDRVVKNVEGDYDPPTMEGLPDFHTYTMWYTNHPIPIGKLVKGYIPPVKKGWMIGCGEYGAEGLDYTDLMQRRYPAEWLEMNEEGNWYPTQIVRAQMNTMHGDWFEEKTTMEDWVRASQKHQANATKLMTEAFRRRADYINHFAIHFLIDMWPAGWMKSLVDCERRPKLAYYAFKEALVSYRINIRCDRKYVHANEVVDVEAWLLNDTVKAQKGKVIASLLCENQIIQSYCLDTVVDGVCAENVGIVSVKFPDVEKETVVYLDATILNKEGKPIHAERLEFYVYPTIRNMKTSCSKVCAIGCFAEEVAEKYGYQKTKLQDADVILCSDVSDDIIQIEKCMNDGKNVLLFLPELETSNIHIGEYTIETKKAPKVYFAAGNKELKKYHFDMLYNGKMQMLDFVSRFYIVCDSGEELLYTYGKNGVEGKAAPKIHLPYVKRISLKTGKLTAISLLLKDKICYNANIDQFIIDLIESKL